MALSQSTLNELKQELSRLREGRNRLEVKIAGVEAILQLAQKQTIRDRPSLGASSTRLQARRRHINGPTFRENITGVIARTSGTGIHAGKVIEELKKAGVTVEGKTSLAKRTYEELRQLVKGGVLHRTGAGKYKNRIEPSAR